MLSLVWLLLYCTGVASSLCRFFCFWCDREEGVEVICLLLRDQPSCSLECLDILILPTIHAAPLITFFRSRKVVSARPNSCLFCNMWFAYADCGLQFLFWLMCSLYFFVYRYRIVLHIHCYMWCVLYCIFHWDYLIYLFFLANCLNIVLVDL